MSRTCAALSRADRLLAPTLALLALAVLVEAQNGPADRLPRLIVPDGVLASGTSVSTAADLVASLADPTASLAVIQRDIQLRELDFAPYSTPFNFKRNFTILGAFSSPAEYPVLDFAFVKAKVRLGPHVRLQLSRIVVLRSREVPQFQAPGMDIFVRGDAVSLASITAVVAVFKSFIVQRACLSDAIVPVSNNNLPRPPLVPGPQATSREYDQSGCTNTSTAPAASRCWPSVNLYTDVAIFATDVEAVSDRPVVAGYILHLVDTPQGCDVLMTDSCIATYGTTGCFYRSFPRINGSGIGDAPSPPEAPAASNNRGSDTAVLLASLLGGLLGGLLLLVLVAAIVWRACKHRQRASRAAVYSKPSSDNADFLAPPPPALVAPSKAATAPPLDDQPAAAPSSDIVYGHADTHGDHEAFARASAALALVVPVTPLTPVLPGIDLACGEVELTGETLGRGAYGRVVVGRYLGAEVAVKLLDLGLLRTAGMDMLQAVPTADDSAMGSRRVAEHALSEGPLEEQALRQEVEILARCCHPNIVRLLAANTVPPRPCLVMEKMETSLERLVHGKGATLLPLPTVLHISSQVASALAYLHPTVLHRDVKPGNILVSNPGSLRPTAKLADFGVSRLLSTVLVTQNPEVGTAPYIAPEVFDLTNQQLTDKVDIYALSIIMWEMLAAERPWSTDLNGGQPNMVMIAFAVTVQRQRPPLSIIPRERCPLKLARLIRSCWDQEPRRRPCAAEVVKTLALVSEALGQ